MHGCDKPRSKPRKIGPFELSICPNRVLSDPDGFRDDVVTAFNDLESGTIQGWPDGYSAALVEGVRYLKAQRIGAQNDEMDRRQREQEREAKRRSAGGRR